MRRFLSSLTEFHHFYLVLHLGDKRIDSMNFVSGVPWLRNNNNNDQQVQHLHKVLAKKRDPVTHVCFLDELNGNRSAHLVQRFWAQVTAMLTQEFARAARGSFIHSFCRRPRYRFPAGMVSSLKNAIQFKLIFLDDVSHLRCGGTDDLELWPL